MRKIAMGLIAGAASLTVTMARAGEVVRREPADPAAAEKVQGNGKPGAGDTRAMMKSTGIVRTPGPDQHEVVKSSGGSGSKVKPAESKLWGDPHVNEKAGPAAAAKAKQKAKAKNEAAGK